MLKIHVPKTELINDRTGEFTYVEEQTLVLEHSLVSISKWEAKFKKPFLSKDPRTDEESIEYLKCMTVNPKVDDSVYKALTQEQINEIGDYIRDPMSATCFAKTEGKAPSRQIITSEMIYYYMVAYQIPFECQKWHLNRLMTLIRICNEKNQPKKKMSRSSIFNQNASLNAARRAASGSKG